MLFNANQTLLLFFSIIDKCDNFPGPRFDKCVVKIWYYAEQNPQHKELIENLASEDLRGRVAERTTSKLFNDLFLYSKWMHHFLPQVFAFHEGIAKKYNFEMKTGKAGFGHDPIPDVKEQQ